MRKVLQVCVCWELKFKELNQSVNTVIWQEKFKKFYLICEILHVFGSASAT